MDHFRLCTLGVKDVKVEFGNNLTRLLWGGVRLLPLEQTVLGKLVDALPAPIRDAVVVQLIACNLVQREVDGRALNFYRKVRGRVSREGIPALPVKAGDVLLLRVAFSFKECDTLLHAAMTAIDRQFFCIHFDQDVRPLGRLTEVTTHDVTSSWRSGIVDAQPTPVSSLRSSTVVTDPCRWRSR